MTSSPPAGRRVAVLGDSPELADAELPFGPGWPKFLACDPIARELMPYVWKTFASFNIVLLDGEDRVLAGGWGVPLRWSGEIDALPDGWDGALQDAVALQRAGEAPTALCAMATEVVRSARGTGLSREVLLALRDRARAHDLKRMIAPARPVLKQRYPLVPIDRFSGWTDEAGRAFDPWIRTHLGLGARILDTTETAMRIVAPVEEWEEMVGMRFPESGDYVVPEALSLVSIDRAAGTGTYLEPAIWVEHPV